MIQSWIFSIGYWIFFIGSLCLPHLHPLFPFLFRDTYAQSVLTPHQRDLQKHGLLGELVEPTLIRELRMLESEAGEAAAVAIEQGLNTEFLSEATKLTGRRRSHL